MDTYPLLPPGAEISAPAIIARISALPREDRIGAVLRHCIELGGTLIRPGQGTHLFEITLLGIHARGEDLAAAARNWLVAGQNQHPEAGEAPPAAEAIDASLLELSRATAILARPAGWGDEKLRAACNSILRLSRDWTIAERARQMLAQLDHEAAARGRA